MNDKTPMSRVFRSKEDARKAYNRMSGFYDLMSGSAEAKAKHLGLDLLAIKTGETALEIGFGTGHSLVILASQVGEDGKVFGVDLSEGMLAVAQSRLERAGLQQRVELKCADATQLPLPDHTLDAVFCSFTLELFDNPEIPLVLAEIRRLLKPHGRTCVVAMGKRDVSNWMIRLYEWAHRTMEKYVDCRPIYTKELLTQAGFQVEKEAGLSMFGLPVDVVLAFNAE